MIEPADLLREAQTLLNAVDDNEVRRRTAVSRAYYAAYHGAKVVAEAAGYRDDGKTSVHAQLGRYFQTSPDRKRKRIASMLKDLRNLRVRADYYLAGDLSASDAEYAIATALRIVSLLPSSSS